MWSCEHIIYIIFSDGVWSDCSRYSYGATVTSHAYCDVTEAEADKPSRSGGEGKGRGREGRRGEGMGADKPSRRSSPWRLVFNKIQSSVGVDRLK